MWEALGHAAMHACTACMCALHSVPAKLAGVFHVNLPLLCGYAGGSCTTAGSPIQLAHFLLHPADLSSPKQSAHDDRKFVTSQQRQWRRREATGRRRRGAPGARRAPRQSSGPRAQPRTQSPSPHRPPHRLGPQAPRCRQGT